MSGIRSREIEVERICGEIDLQRVEVGLRVGGTISRIRRWVNRASLMRAGVGIALPFLRKSFCSRSKQPLKNCHNRRTNLILPLSLAFCVGWLVSGRVENKPKNNHQPRNLKC